MKAFVLFALGVAVAQGPQEAPSPQKLYEAGSYQQAIETISTQEGEVSPSLEYLAGQSHLRLNQRDEAKARFDKLRTEGEPTTWSLVGESASALIEGNNDRALETATKAVEMSPDDFYANYQLGLVNSSLERWTPAASSFEKAAAIDPMFAYAHYYAGMAQSKVKRLDLMASHLEYFLKLAPDAPERPAVLALMRSVRGR